MAQGSSAAKRSECICGERDQLEGKVVALQGLVAKLDASCERLDDQLRESTQAEGMAVAANQEWRDMANKYRQQRDDLRTALEHVSQWLNEPSPPWPDEESALEASGVANLVEAALRRDRATERSDGASTADR